MEIKVSESTYWIGVNDRRKNLFENIWPLPNGVSYNSYLIDDRKTALLDTIETGSNGSYVESIEKITGDKGLDYLIINHMEPDHSGEIGSIVRRYPNIRIVGNNKTFKILEAYFGIKDNLIEVKDGDTLELGEHTLKFVMTPWVHWPETMMAYDCTDHTLFSGDAFGTFGTLDGSIFDDEIDFEHYREEMRRYYSCIVGKYSNMVQKAFAKLNGTTINCICPLHGPVWRTNPQKVVELYDRWSRYVARKGVVIVYASMYGNTAHIADYIGRRLTENGVKEVKIYDVSKTHISYLISDIWKYEGVILGSCAYNAGMFPLMENLTREIENYGIKNKQLGIFGSHSWNGGGVRALQTFAQNIGWQVVGEPQDIYGTPNVQSLAQCDQIAVAMANALK